MMSDELVKLEGLVRLMRESQKRYFRHRQTMDLEAAKDYERQVDQQLRRLKDLREDDQPKLF